MGEVEPAKLLLPFLQRAKELQKHDPLVAYYCRLYAMERGLKIPAKERTKATNALLVSLMNQLEKDKKTVKLSQDDHLYVEGFALNVFAKADKQDRAGHADLETAKTFYAASLFFEVLHQFGELQPDIEQKQKYSVWKAADIRKALSEGRKPQPGPPVGDEDFLVSEDVTMDMKVSPQKSGMDLGAEILQHDQGDSSTSSERIERSGSMKADVRPKTSEMEASQSAQSTLFSSPEFPQTMSQPLYPTSNSSLIPTGDQSSYPTPYPVVQIRSHNPSLSQLDGTPSITENAYHTSTCNHELRVPSNVSYYSQPDLPSAPTHSPYPMSYVTAPMTYYPSPPESSLPGAPNSLSDASEHASSEASAAGYAETLQSHRMTAASSTPAQFSGQETYERYYQPPPERIAEAHKASRYAVSALAFDDVPAAISYLKKSLELLTSPSMTTD